MPSYVPPVIVVRDVTLDALTLNSHGSMFFVFVVPLDNLPPVLVIVVKTVPCFLLHHPGDSFITVFEPFVEASVFMIPGSSKHIWAQPLLLFCWALFAEAILILVMQPRFAAVPAQVAVQSIKIEAGLAPFILFPVGVEFVAAEERTIYTVSYTHLTLPTICSV